MGIFDLFTDPAKSEMKAELIAAKGHHYMGFDLEKAISYYDEAIRKYPKYFRVYNHRAFAKICLRDYNGAISDSTESIHLNKQDADAWVLRATAKEYKGDLIGALVDVSEAVNIDPNYGKAYYEAGQILKQMGETEKAIGAFMNAKVRGETLADMELDKLNQKQNYPDSNS